MVGYGVLHGVAQIQIAWERGVQGISIGKFLHIAREDRRFRLVVA